jgi:hypothetical protein
MKTYTINIGRNNNQLADKFQVLSTFSAILELSRMKLGYVNNIRMDGKYTDGVEPTFVAEFQAEDRGDIFTLLDLCTKIYTQECIAISSNGRDWNTLYYNIAFDGPKMEFDYDYFLWIKEEEE